MTSACSHLRGLHLFIYNKPSSKSRVPRHFQRATYWTDHSSVSTWFPLDLSAFTDLTALNRGKPHSSPLDLTRSQWLTCKAFFITPISKVWSPTNGPSWVQKCIFRGQHTGVVVKFTCSTLAARSSWVQIPGKTYTLFIMLCCGSIPHTK